MKTNWMVEHDVGEHPSRPTYRVRIWAPPPTPSHTWALDEYEVSDAPDVLAVIKWAENESKGNPVEVFLKWFDTGITSNYDTISIPQMTRVYGDAPKEN